MRANEESCQKKEGRERRTQRGTGDAVRQQQQRKQNVWVTTGKLNILWVGSDMTGSFPYVILTPNLIVYNVYRNL